ncbi:hypothetical protein [Halogeometricum limi]|uniref:Uncharacterized protein n=1 Tax=Halogeometricum limi TaxID=555875 RepID=A0A1I6H7W1_9EURY|nr:hypothetical protein [Halogeometricum limi]SFR50448.1 hypothetical protein SAMN04488124_1883 [Halogeometricum limi]
MSWVVWTDRLGGQEGTALVNVLLVGLGTTTVAVVFLFVVVGAFIDRELNARGLDTSEE